MVEFAYNNSQNASMGYIPFELNYNKHPQISFKNKWNTCFKSSSANWLAIKQRELINVCRQNFLNTQDLQKQVYDKVVKPQNYALNEKVWLNIKYIKNKWNWKLETKFFGPFQVLHQVRK